MPVSFQNAQGIREYLEDAARHRDPHLPALWNVISKSHLLPALSHMKTAANRNRLSVIIQVNLIDPATKAIRSFAEFTHRRAYDPMYGRFAESVYEWLIFLHRADLTAEGLAKIGHTKPGLVEKLKKTLASHEIGHPRKARARENHPAGQAYKRIYMTEADFMVGEGAMEYLGRPNAQILESQIRDIPTSETEKLRYVDEMVTALKNMAGKLPGFENQVNHVKKTSASIFETLAWRLFVSPHPSYSAYMRNPLTICYIGRFPSSPAGNAQGLALGYRLLLAQVLHLESSLEGFNPLHEHQQSGRRQLVPQLLHYPLCRRPLQGGVAEEPESQDEHRQESEEARG